MSCTKLIPLRTLAIFTENQRAHALKVPPTLGVSDFEPGLILLPDGTARSSGFIPVFQDHPRGIYYQRDHASADGSGICQAASI